MTITPDASHETLRQEAKVLIHHLVARWVEDGHPPHVLAETMLASGGALLSIDAGDEATADLLQQVAWAILRTAGKEQGTRH